MARLIRVLLDLAKLALIGAIASGVDYLILLVLVNAGFPIWVSGSVGYVTGTIIVYLSANKFVFTSRNASKPVAELALFLVAGAVGMLINSAILEFATNSLSMSLLAAKIVSIVTVFIWNTAARVGIVIWLRRPEHK